MALFSGKSRRQHERIEHDEIFVLIDGYEIRLHDVSRGGARLEVGNGAEMFKPNEEILLKLVIYAYGVDKRLETLAKVVRIDEVGVSLNFMDDPFSKLV